MDSQSHEILYLCRVVKQPINVSVDFSAVYDSHRAAQLLNGRNGHIPLNAVGMENFSDVLFMLCQLVARRLVTSEKLPNLGA